MRWIVPSNGETQHGQPKGLADSRVGRASPLGAVSRGVRVAGGCRFKMHGAGWCEVIRGGGTSRYSARCAVGRRRRTANFLGRAR